MKLFVAMLAIVACIIVTLRAVRSHRAAKEKRVAEEQKRLVESKEKEKREREKADDAEATLLELSPEILKLRDEIHGLSDYGSGYLMKKDWDALLVSAAPTLSSIAKIPTSVIKTSDFAEAVSYVTSRCRDEFFRESRNDEYKKRELTICNALLSNVDGGKSLDPQQRDAVVTDEYNNLVIAGAGSGKTSVVVGKVKYLVDRWHVDPVLASV